VSNARVSWGIGIIVAILLSAAVYSFGLVDPYYAISLVLLLVGLWTIACAFFLVDRKDQWYYSGWGVVLAFLSSFAYLQKYTIGLVLIAIVALILLYVYVGGTSKMITAASAPSSPAGGTPAATAS
jgi:hypothetical protein